MAGSDDENPPPPPSPQTLTQQAPYIVSTIKLPILKGKVEFQSLLSQLEMHMQVVSLRCQSEVLRSFTLLPGPSILSQWRTKQEVVEQSYGTLLENANQKEIKKAEGEMQGTLDIKQNTIGGDLENRRNLKLWAIQAQTLSQAATTSTAMKVNTARPIVNEIRPRNNFYKPHSPNRRPFNRTTTPRTKFSNQKVNTAGDKAVSAVGGIRGKTADYPQRTLKNKWIVDSGCSRHMTGNKAYLAEYQDYNGGPVAFGGEARKESRVKTERSIFEQLALMGYATNSDKLTFQKVPPHDAEISAKKFSDVLRFISASKYGTIGEV
ncbi:hypothetical protein Tco_0857086 [Tanacetum coccineum]|uniref:Retrovirus-related Pol polyprotein from transposon TNT 1-94-like beta-barrel domain-containing protein n=1 Tax=Tanacetum coccineum TaxID=301880 RepID=A0ABQ5BAV6_9ASTR